MLPDYVETKCRLQDFFNRWLRRRVRDHLGPFGEIPRYRVFEGERTSIVRADHSIETTEFRDLTSEFTVTFDEVPELTLEKVLQRLDRVAQDMADNLARHVYRTISEVADSTGNVVSGGISAEKILEVFEKIEIQFNDNGEAELPQVHVHPSMTQTLTEAFARLKQDPELKARFDRIISEKKRAWRVREADRKLVG